jgi:hypothetical protein
VPLPSIAARHSARPGGADRRADAGGRAAAAVPRPAQARLQAGPGAARLGLQRGQLANSAIGENQRRAAQEGHQAGRRPDERLRRCDRATADPPGESYAGPPRPRLIARCFAQVAKARQTDPNFLPDYGRVDKGSFDQLVAARRKAQLQDVARQAPDGLGFAGFSAASAPLARPDQLSADRRRSGRGREHRQPHPASNGLAGARSTWA